MSRFSSGSMEQTNPWRSSW